MTRPGFKYISKYKGYVRTTLPEKSITVEELESLRFQCACCGRVRNLGELYTSKSITNLEKNSNYLICLLCAFEEPDPNKEERND